MINKEDDERTFEEELKIGLYDQSPSEFKSALINVHDTMWAARKMLIQHSRGGSFTAADIVALTDIIMREVERSGDS